MSFARTQSIARALSLLGGMTVLGGITAAATGCPGSQVAADPYLDRKPILSIRWSETLPEGTETVPQEGPRYYKPGEYVPGKADDPYFREAYVAESIGNVGQFGMIVENLDPKETIKEIFMYYMIEDVNKIIYPFPIRIADHLMLDGKDRSWFHVEPWYYDNSEWPFYPGVTLGGWVHARQKFIDFPPGGRWEGYAMLIGTEDMKIRVSAYGILEDGTFVGPRPGEELTLHLKPAVEPTPRTITPADENVLCGAECRGVWNKSAEKASR